MKPESRKAFVRYWARVVATEIRSEVALPGSGKFDLADIEQRLALRLQDDPKARFHSIPMIAKQIVAQADSTRLPCRKDFEETGDLFGFEHKWIPLGQRRIEIARGAGELAGRALRHRGTGLGRRTVPVLQSARW
jgi:hypothetical protein